MLDAPRGFACMDSMKTKFFLALLSLTVVAAGCISTVDDRKTAGVPWIKDRIEAKYDRPADEVFQAAKEVIAKNGVLVNEGILHGQTNAVNQIVRTVQGNVNESRVWVRIEQADPRVTSVTVQTRTKGGISDVDLAASIDKQIALRLVR